MSDFEEWRNVVGYEGLYKISSKGRLFSEKRVITRRNGAKQTVGGKIYNGHVTVYGYRTYNLSSSLNNSRLLMAHVLVAESFIPKVAEKKIINHKDGNKLNNNVENLEWCNHSENTVHAFKTGLMIPAKGERIHTSRFLSDDVLGLVEGYGDGFTVREISEHFNVHRQTVRDILSGRTWKHLTGINKCESGKPQR